jgi:Rad3-related DNA helicase
VYSNYLSKFPEGFEPLPQQIRLIKEIEEAFKTNKFVICSAPTGSGKSFISKTLGNNANECSPKFFDLINSYRAFKQDAVGSYTYEEDCLKEKPFGAMALTITKSLQDQYHKLFQDAYLLKGKSNYTCEVDPNFDVETAPCVLTPKLKDECWMSYKCPYYNSRNTALTNVFSVLNYKMFLSLPGHVKRKNFLICDEASELEDEIVKQFTLFIDPDKLIKLGLKVPLLYKTEPESILMWVNQLSQVLVEYISDIVIDMTERKKKVTITEKMKLKYFKHLHSTVKLVIETWGDCEYVCHRDGKTVRLMPLKVSNLSKFIFDSGEKVLLMSATIIDHKKFAETLGIKDYVFVEAESSFDPKKAPIYITSKFKLNKANLESHLPALTQQIQKLCDKHKDEKGIIHTHTLQITKYLQNNLKGNRFLFRSDEAVNEEILNQHSQATVPTVLVSPSMAFGVDLKDDLARFQIVVKAAYLPLGDTRIKKLFDSDKQWYVDKMLCNLVQACGRGNRSKDDYCVTYILDGVLLDAIMQNKDKLPKYFIDRFV